MLDALEQFAFGARGPDKMRHEALRALFEQRRVNAGPHRFFSNGKWIEINLFQARITWEPQPCAPWAQELVESGSEALRRGDFAAAEESFNRILDEDPDFRTAAFNLCAVWLQRDGIAGARRARARLEEIHQRFPDYRHATIALAQLTGLAGDVQRARDLLAPLYSASELHGSEAIALFVAEIQIAVACREFARAEQCYAMLTQIAGEDDPKVIQLRRRIDGASRGGGLRRFLFG